MRLMEALWNTIARLFGWIHTSREVSENVKTRWKQVVMMPVAPEAGKLPSYKGNYFNFFLERHPLAIQIIKHFL